MSLKLAGALKRAFEKADKGIVKSAALSRDDRELLLDRDYLHPIVRGWYFLTNGSIPEGSTVWASYYWDFLRVYLSDRFGIRYCLSAEASILLHAESPAVPVQMAVAVTRGGNRKLDLPGGTSLIRYVSKIPKGRESVRGLQVMPLPIALAKAGLGFQQTHQVDLITAIKSLRDPNDLYRQLVEGRNVRGAKRLADFCRSVGLTRITDGIADSMKVAGIALGVSHEKSNIGFTLSGYDRRMASPAVDRLHALWDKYVPQTAGVVEAAEIPGGLSIRRYLERTGAISTDDAYHSLSIEGFTVTPELIEKIQRGDWKPEAEDETNKDAMAAKGYLRAFDAVLDSIEAAWGSPCQGTSTQAAVAERDHQKWFQSLFSAFVSAEIVAPKDLIGYRRRPVFIKSATHVPPAMEKVTSLMEAMFERLKAEENSIVAAILGHFFFVYIHPYMDGNGRIARFLMNQLASRGGHPWTIIHVEVRSKYIRALEKASVAEDIREFARLVCAEMKREPVDKGKQLAASMKKRLERVARGSKRRKAKKRK